MIFVLGLYFQTFELPLPCCGNVYVIYIYIYESNKLQLGKAT
jgi:hypothetical protein